MYVPNLPDDSLKISSDTPFTKHLCPSCWAIVIDFSSESLQSFKLGTVRGALHNSQRGCQFCTLILLDFDQCEPHISTLGAHLLYGFIESRDQEKLKIITVDGGNITNFSELDLDTESGGNVTNFSEFDWNTESGEYKETF